MFNQFGMRFLFLMTIAAAFLAALASRFPASLEIFLTFGGVYTAFAVWMYFRGLRIHRELEEINSKRKDSRKRVESELNEQELKRDETSRIARDA